MKHHVGILAAKALVVFALASCAPASVPAVTIENAWGRPSPTMPGVGGIYIVIKNTGEAPDKLLSGKSDVCGVVEVREMVKKADGTLGMNLVTEPVEIPAGGQVDLKSGDLHIRDQ